MIKKFKIILITLFLIAPQHAFASENIGAVNNFVQALSDDVLDILNSKNDYKVVQQQLAKKFHNTMDIDWMAKFVIGKHWRKLSQDQKMEYVANYKDFLTSSYVPIFKNYNGQKIKIDSIKYIGSSYYIVKTIIKRNNSDTDYTVEYRVKDLNGSYKVRDIIAEGISMLSTQRSEFSSVISNQGITSLNSQLVKKTADSQ